MSAEEFRAICMKRLLGVRCLGTALVNSTKAPPRRRTPRTRMNSLAFPLMVFLVIPPLPVQDFGGSLAFQGQDIIGGAAVIFKAPKRVKDLTGGAAAMMASRRPQRTGRSSDVARNDRRPTPTTTTATTTTTTATASERAEALKAQGNIYYDQGQFAQALE